MKNLRINSTQIIALVVALALIPLSGAIGAQERDAWIDVLSVQMDANGLIIIVCEGFDELKLADGTRATNDKVEAVFEGGKLVSLTENERHVDSFFLAADGAVMMKVEEGERPIPDGYYRLDSSRRSGTGKDPRVTDFRVSNGNVVSAHVDYF